MFIINQLATVFSNSRMWGQYSHVPMHDKNENDHGEFNVVFVKV